MSLIVHFTYVQSFLEFLGVSSACLTIPWFLCTPVIISDFSVIANRLLCQDLSLHTYIISSKPGLSGLFTWSYVFVNLKPFIGSCYDVGIASSDRYWWLCQLTSTSQPCAAYLEATSWQRCVLWACYLDIYERQGTAWGRKILCRMFS